MQLLEALISLLADKEKGTYRKRKRERERERRRKRRKRKKNKKI